MKVEQQELDALAKRIYVASVAGFYADNTSTVLDEPTPKGAFVRAEAFLAERSSRAAPVGEALTDQRVTGHGEGQRDGIRDAVKFLDEQGYSLAAKSLRDEFALFFPSTAAGIQAPVEPFVGLEAFNDPETGEPLHRVVKAPVATSLDGPHDATGYVAPVEKPLWMDSYAPRAPVERDERLRFKVGQFVLVKSCRDPKATECLKYVGQFARVIKTTSLRRKDWNGPIESVPGVVFGDGSECFYDADEMEPVPEPAPDATGFDEATALLTDARWVLARLPSRDDDIWRRMNEVSGEIDSYLARSRKVAR